MADIYVDPVNGNDNRSGNSTVNAVKTLVKGASKLTDGDRLVAMPGKHGPQATNPTDSNHRAVKIRGGTRVFFQPGAWFDQEYQYEYGFMHANKDANDVVFENIVFRRAGCMLAWRGVGFEIMGCDVRLTNSHAFSINQFADNGYIHDNYLEDNDQEKSARSGISIYAPEDSGQAGMTIAGIVTPNWSGPWGFVIARNVVVRTGYPDAPNADGNGIIFDCGYDPTGVRVGSNGTDYLKHSYIGDNIIVDAYGCGIKSMMSRNVHLHRNTCVSNKKNTFMKPTDSPLPTRWHGELAVYHSGYNFVTENIGASTLTHGGAFCIAKFNGMGGESVNFVDNNVYDRNMFSSVGDGRLVYEAGSNPSPTGPAATSVASEGVGGYFPAPSATLTDIFVNPVITGAPGKDDPTAAGAKIGQDAIDLFRGRFALKAGHVALTAAADNGPIGAVRGVVPPVVVLTNTVRPVMEILGTPIDTSDPDHPVYPVGATVRFTLGSYNLTPDSYTYGLQWYNGTKYEDKATTITGPVSGWYSTTAPVVTKKGGLRPKVVATKAGHTAVTSYADWIDIAPAPVVTGDPPVNTTPPSVSPTGPVVGSAATVSPGVWEGAPTYQYQWQRGTTDIVGAINASYTPVAADKPNTLRVKVTATNDHGSTVVYSAPTSVVVDPPSMTLEQVISRLLAVEAKANATDLTAMQQVARNDSQDATIAAIEAAFGLRIGALEEDLGGLRPRVTDLEGQVEGIRIDFEDTASKSQFDELETKVNNVVLTQEETSVVLTSLSAQVSNIVDPTVSAVVPATRGPAYLLPDDTIDCEVLHPLLGWVRFLARENDTIAYGRALHAYWAARSGDLVEGYPPEE